jgi:hypothetical protein
MKALWEIAVSYKPVYSCNLGAISAPAAQQGMLLIGPLCINGLWERSIERRLAKWFNIIEIVCQVATRH